MDCRRSEELLFERLEGRLTGAEEASLHAHLSDCRRCGELRALLAGDAAGETSGLPEVPADLLAGVLQRTSGDACGSVALRLAEALDGPGREAAGHEPAMVAHLEHCAACRRLAGALARLSRELPALAELDPGADFVTGVMAATARAGVAGRLPRIEPVVDWRTRLHETLQRFAARPRFALEGAYAVALVVVLIFGLPSASLAELPARALDGVRGNAARVQVVAASGLDAARDYGRATWSEAAARIDDWLPTEQDAAAAGVSELTLRRWAAALRDVAAGIWNNLFAPFADNLRALWRPERGADNE